MRGTVAARVLNNKFRVLRDAILHGERHYFGFLAILKRCAVKHRQCAGDIICAEVLHLFDCGHFAALGFVECCHGVLSVG
jgi:hypothetical protein